MNVHAEGRSNDLWQKDSMCSVFNGSAHGIPNFIQTEIIFCVRCVSIWVQTLAQFLNIKTIRFSVVSHSSVYNDEVSARYTHIYVHIKVGNEKGTNAIWVWAEHRPTDRPNRTMNEIDSKMHNCKRTPTNNQIILGCRCIISLRCVDVELKRKQASKSHWM